jgi:hypothetical protein
MLSKMDFLNLLMEGLGEEKAVALLTTPGKIALIYAAASAIAFDDVFIGSDGAGGYAGHILASGLITPTQAEALRQAWPQA